MATIQVLCNHTNQPTTMAAPLLTFAKADAYLAQGVPVTSEMLLAGERGAFDRFLSLQMEREEWRRPKGMDLLDCAPPPTSSTPGSWMWTCTRKPLGPDVVRTMVKVHGTSDQCEVVTVRTKEIDRHGVEMTPTWTTLTNAPGKYPRYSDTKKASECVHAETIEAIKGDGGTSKNGWC